MRTHEGGSVTADDPWPGLLSFHEADQRFFRGRTEETNALLQLTRRDTLTVLFGRAGLGKTSLLRAGVFPYLREESFLPVYIRLAYAPGSVSLRQQVFEALRLAGRDAAIVIPQSADTTLWEYFHGRDVELWDRNRLVIPVLVFDQFEEIFTHGRSRQAEVNDFLDDLAALVTGRPPQRVWRRIEGNAAASRLFDFTRRSYRVLVSLREDFVPHLETLRNRVSSILDRRLRLEPMHGKAAREVLSAGAQLLGPGADDAILRFVASPRGTAVTDLPLEQLVIEPALLSVVCRELNEKRRAGGQPHITTDLLKGTKTEIIAAFYERGVHDYPAARAFIEENLITDEGFRVPIACERARRAGIPDAVLDALIQQHRLIRPIRIGDVDHIELTHDLLTDAIRESRDERRKRELVEAERTLARTRKSLFRARAAMAVFLVLFVAAATAIAFAWAKGRETARYKRLAAQNDVRLGVRLLEDGNTGDALALLANALRRDGENLVARRLVLGILLGRRWPTLEREVPLRDFAVKRSADGSRVAVLANDTVQVFDVPTGREIRSFHVVDEVTCVTFNDDGRLLAIGTRSGSVSLWDIDETAALGAWELHRDFVRALAVTHDGGLLASGANDRVINVVDVTRSVTTPRTVKGLVYDLEFSPAGDRLVSASRIEFEWLEEEPEGDAEVMLWAMPQFERINDRSMFHGDAIWSVHFNPDGSRVVSASWDKTAQVWDAETGAALGPALAHSDWVTDAEFSPDGTLLVTVSRDRTARIWYVEYLAKFKTAPVSWVLQHKNEVVKAHFIADGSAVVTASGDGTARLWTLDGRPLTEPIAHSIGVTEAWGTSGKATIATVSGATLRYWSFNGVVADSIAAKGAPVVPVTEDTIVATDAKAFYRTNLKSRRAEKIDLETKCQTTAISPDGQWLACEGFQTFDLLRADTGRRLPPIAEMQGIQPHLYPVFSSDSHYILAAVPGATFEADNVVVIDVTRRVVLPFAMRHDDSVYGKAFDRTGRLVVTASADGFARVWDGRTGKLLHKSGRARRDEHDTDAIISHAEFDPDASRVVYSSWDQTATIWTLAIGHKIVLQHGNNVNHAAFSPDGKLLVTGSSDFTARLWRSDTGAPVGESMTHSSEVTYAAFSPDGQKVVTVSKDGSARVWDAATGSPLTNWFRHAGEDWKPIFLQNGAVLLTQQDSDLRFLDFPASTPADASRLADLAEAIRGYRVEQDGALAPSGDRRILMQRIAGADPKAQDPATRFARWYLADPRQRSISPFSSITPVKLVRGSSAGTNSVLHAETSILFPWAFTRPSDRNGPN